MRTDRAVTVHKGAKTISAVGMESSNATRELFLLNRAKVVYPPVRARR